MRKLGEANNPKKTVSTVKHGGVSNKTYLGLGEKLPPDERLLTKAQSPDLADLKICGVN